MRRVLLVSHVSTHFRELRRVAQLLANTTGWQPLLWFSRPYAHVGGDLAWARERGLECLGAVHESTSISDEPLPSAGWEVLRGLASLFPEALKTLPRTLIRRPVARRRFQRLRASASALIAETRAELVVVAEDSLDLGTPLMVQAAHARGVPVVVVPFTIPNPGEPAEAFFHNPTRQVRFGNRGFAKRHPRWIHEHRGRQLLRMPVGDALAAEDEGVGPPFPWILNSGATDAIAVESPAMAEIYRRFGFPEAQLVVTGALAEDDLARSMAGADAGRAALRKELDLPATGPLFVCALPPDQHPQREPGTCEFPNHAAVVRFWIEALLAVPGSAVVANAHPRTDPDVVAFLEGLRAPDGRRARLVRRDIASLIPICDVYVAPASATIRLSLACGKPTVNYDVYRFRYDDYRDSPVRPVEDGAAFRELVRRLGTDAAFLAEVAAKTAADRERWGRLDGRSGERMLALFERLAPGKT